MGRLAPGQVALAIEGALAGAAGPAVRSRLVETLGPVPGPIAGRALLAARRHPGEHPTVRLAAVAALGDRPADAAAVGWSAISAGRTATSEPSPGSPRSIWASTPSSVTGPRPV